MMRLRMNEGMRLRRAIGMMVVAGCCAAGAQQPPQVQTMPQIGVAQQRGGPTGQVSGTVIAADTQQPARFVQVTLVSTAAASTPNTTNFNTLKIRFPLIVSSSTFRKFLVDSL